MPSRLQIVLVSAGPIPEMFRLTPSRVLAPKSLEEVWLEKKFLHALETMTQVTPISAFVSRPVW
jgi:hypothetical protein